MASLPFRQRVPSLIAGISTQADTIRFPTQVEDAENVDFDVVDGATRRPGSHLHYHFFGGINGEKYRLFKIERDDQEEYAIVYGQNVLEVVDLNNKVKATITKSAEAQTYLNSGNPTVDDFVFLTIADTTLIANKKVATEVSADGSSITNTSMPIKLTRTQAFADGTLTFTLDVINFNDRPLYEQIIKANENITGGSFQLAFRTSADEEIIAPRSLSPGGNSTSSPNGRLPFNALASRFTEGAAGIGVDQKLEEIENIGDGKVICTGGPLPRKDILIQLSRDIDVTRLIEPVNFDLAGGVFDIVRGSNDRNPPPEFIRLGLPVVELGYYKNRLLLGSDEFLAFSQVDDLFDFYVETPAVLADSDAIDLQLSTEDVSVIQHVVNFNGQLVVFTKQGRQFILDETNNVLSPSTASITSRSKYETQDVRPVLIGNRLYFLGKTSGYTVCYEYYFDDVAGGNVANDISKQAQGLIPTSIQSMVSSTPLDKLFIFETPNILQVAGATAVFNPTGSSGNWIDAANWDLNTAGGAALGRSAQPFDTVVIPAGKTCIVTSDVYADIDLSTAPNVSLGSSGTATVYTWTQYAEGRERAQSAWGKWTLGADAVLDGIIVDSDMYTLRREDTSSPPRLCLDRIPLADTSTLTNFTEQVFMDHKISNVDANPVSVSDSSGNTVFTMPTVDGVQLKDPKITHMVHSGSPTILRSVTPLNGGASFTIADASNEFQGGTVVLGRKYDSFVELSKPYFRDGEQKPVTEGKTVVNKLMVDLKDTGDIKTEITPLENVGQREVGGTSTRTEIKTSSTSSTRSEQFIVTGDAQKQRIKISSVEARPMTIASLEIYGTYSTNQQMGQ